ncbi:GntR family transcriptional regulator [Priestia endophytica]|jgi:DNA-binding GntR family transcriptional regulator|uniref:GntR family transcriptional regulator n=1 Tax=Priestia endophytica TaxID=135735 RepID=UPI000F54400F|nr:GntR family transcriptional regulator [Priestia endophytica]RPK05925.1 hypothetical protein FH5_01854 [Priestia endophytica]
METINKRTGLALSLKDKVRQELRNEIILNRLKPGERIIETEIAKKFGTSQVPVREALRGLEEEGLVESIKYKGAFVTEIDMSEIHHIYTLRAQIETTVIKLILPTLSHRHFGELYDIIEEMKNQQSDYGALSALDAKFHWKLIEWGGSEIYIRIWNMLSGHIRRFIAVVHPTIEDKHIETYENHKKLIEILESKDIEKAQTAFRDHIMKFFDENRM